VLSRNVTRAPARRADSLLPAGPHPRGSGLNDPARAVASGQTTGQAEEGRRSRPVFRTGPVCRR
jgi:hypothetical protein